MRKLMTGLALAAGAASAGAQVLNLRPGGWEFTTSTAGQGAPSTTKTCLKKEDLDAGRVFREFQEDDDNCTYNFRTRTATRVTGTIVCTGDAPQKLEFEWIVQNPETFRSKTTASTNKGPVVYEMSGRFASASCKGYKD